MISVCLAAFNGEKYIAEQVISILSQLSEEDELVISDDCSTDGTIAIVNKFQDRRVRVYSNNCRVGYSANFEVAIKLARGDIIFLSDQDDVWIPGRVSIMCELLKVNSLVACNATFVDSELKQLGLNLFQLRSTRSGFVSNLYKLRYIGACMAFKREILKKILPFPKRGDLCPHDMWIALISEFYFNVGLTSDELILYRRHPGVTSNGGLKSKNNFTKMLAFRLYSVVHVFSRFFR